MSPCPRMDTKILRFSEMLSALFYGLLLKGVGCSSKASKMSALIDADDVEAKRRVSVDS